VLKPWVPNADLHATSQVVAAAERSAHVERGPAAGELITDRCVVCRYLIRDRHKIAARVIFGLGLRQTCNVASREDAVWMKA
jgi:hypothetical protein